MDRGTILWCSPNITSIGQKVATRKITSQLPCAPKNSKPIAKYVPKNDPSGPNTVKARIPVTKIVHMGTKITFTAFGMILLNNDSIYDCDQTIKRIGTTEE